LRMSPGRKEMRTVVESEWPEPFHEEPLARLMSCPSGALI
jgi:hypothetical protein